MIKRQAKKEDYNKLYHFLSKNYDCGNFQNWDVGRLTFCRYAVNNAITYGGEQDWFAHIWLWEQEGEIVALWHNEEPNQYFLQISEEYKYLEEEILKDILEDVKARFPEMEMIELTAFAEDKERIRLLEQYGGVKLEFEDKKRRIILKEEKQEYMKIPYRAVTVEKENALLCTKLAETYQYVWPESSYVPSGKVISDMLSDDNGEIMAWAILDTEEQCVAYTMGFMDSEQEYVHLYPVAVRQECLEEGVLEMLLDTIKNELFRKNIQFVVINAWYKAKEDIIFFEKGAKEWKTEYFYQIPI